MLRRLGAVALVATLMLGSAAWGGTEWSGDASVNWDGTDANWTTDGGSTHVAYPGATTDAIFGASGGNQGIVVDVGGMTANSVTVTGGTYTFTGGVVTGGALAVNGGSLGLSTNNIFTSVSITDGTLSISSTGNIGGSVVNISLNGAGGLTLAAGGTYSNAISVGAGGGKINTTGTTILDGTLTGTGNLLIEGGGSAIVTTLANHTNYGGAASIVTVKNATLNMGQAFSTGTTVDLDSTATLKIGSSGTYNNKYTGDGLLNVSGTGVVLSGNNSGLTGGILINNAGSAEISNKNQLGMGAVTLDDGTLKMGANVTDAANNIIVNSGTGGTINTNGNNFATTGTLTGAGNLTVSGGGSAKIDDLTGYTNIISVTDSGTALIMGGNTGVGAEVNMASDASAEISGVIDSAISTDFTGSGSVKVTDGSTVRLTGANTYSGDTIVDGGSKVKFIDDSSFGSGTQIVLDNGTVEYDGSTSGTLSKNVTTGTGGGTIRAPGVAGTADLTVTGVVTANDGVLIKDGSAAVILSNANNDFTAGLNIKGGAVVSGAQGALGNSGAGTDGTITFTGGGASLVLSSSQVVSNEINLNGFGGTINTGAFSANQTGKVTGSGGLIKTGSGTLTLGAAGNNYTGGTIIASGIVQIVADSALGDTNGKVTLGSTGNEGTLATSATVSTDRDFEVVGNGGMISAYNVFTARGNFTGTGDLQFFTTTSVGGFDLTDATISTYTGSKVTVDGAAGGSYIKVSSAFNGGSAATEINLKGNDTTVRIDQGNTIGDFGNKITGVGGVHVAGGGTVKLTNSGNSYTGLTNVYGGSTLQFNDVAVLGAGTTINLYDLGGIEYTGTGDATLSKDITATTTGTGGGIIKSSSPGTLTLDGIVAGATRTITKQGTGNVTLNNADNDFTSGLKIEAGTITVGVADALGAGAKAGQVTFGGAGATLAFGVGGIFANDIDLGSVGGIIDTGVNNVTENGTISGTGPLEKKGSGELIIANADTTGANKNSYTGGTKISEGTVTISHDSHLGAAGTPGGRLAGNGIQLGNGTTDGTLKIVTNAVTSARDIIVTNSISNGNTIQANADFTTTGNVTGSAGTNLKIASSNGSTVALNGNNGGFGGAGSVVTVDSAVLQQSTSFATGTVINGGSWIIGPNASGDWGQVYQGTGTLTVVGANTDIALIGDNSHSGGTIIDATDGTSKVTITKDANLGAASGKVTLKSGGELIVNTNDVTFTDREVAINTWGKLTTIKNLTLDGTSKLYGTGNLVKDGAGALYLKTDSTGYNGATTIANGAIQVGHNKALGSGQVSYGTAASQLIIDDGINIGNVQYIGTVGGTVTVNDTNTGTLSGNITGSTGILSKTGTGKLVIDKDNSTTLTGGGITVMDGTVRAAQNGALGGANAVFTFGASDTILELADTTSFGNKIDLSTNGGIVDVATGESSTLSGLITGTANGLTLQGGGTLYLANTGNNDYIGGTVIIDGSTVSVTKDRHLGATGAANGVTLGDASTAGTLDIVNAGTFTTDRNFNIGTAGGTIQTTGNFTGTGAFTMDNLPGGPAFTLKGNGADLVFDLTGADITGFNGTEVSLQGTGSKLRISDQFGGGLSTKITMENFTTVIIDGDSGVFSNKVTGTGDVLVTNNSDIDISNPGNDYSGSTTVDTGSNVLVSGMIGVNLATSILNNSGKTTFTGTWNGRNITNNDELTFKDVSTYIYHSGATITNVLAAIERLDTGMTGFVDAFNATGNDGILYITGDGPVASDLILRAGDINGKVNTGNVGSFASVDVKDNTLLIGGLEPGVVILPADRIDEVDFSGGISAKAIDMVDGVNKVSINGKYNVTDNFNVEVNETFVMNEKAYIAGAGTITTDAAVATTDLPGRLQMDWRMSNWEGDVAANISDNLTDSLLKVTNNGVLEFIGDDGAGNILNVAVTVNGTGELDTGTVIEFNKTVATVGAGSFVHTTGDDVIFRDFVTTNRVVVDNGVTFMQKQESDLEVTEGVVNIEDGFEGAFSVIGDNTNDAIVVNVKGGKDFVDTGTGAQVLGGATQPVFTFNLEGGKADFSARDSLTLGANDVTGDIHTKLATFSGNGELIVKAGSTLTVNGIIETRGGTGLAISTGASGKTNIENGGVLRIGVNGTNDGFSVATFDGQLNFLNGSNLALTIGAQNFIQNAYDAAIPPYDPDVTLPPYPGTEPLYGELLVKADELNYLGAGWDVEFGVSQFRTLDYYYTLRGGAVGEILFGGAEKIKGTDDEKFFEYWKDVEDVDLTGLISKNGALDLVGTARDIIADSAGDPDLWTVADNNLIYASGMYGYSGMTPPEKLGLQSLMNYTGGQFAAKPLLVSIDNMRIAGIEAKQYLAPWLFTGEMSGASYGNTAQTGSNRGYASYDCPTGYNNGFFAGGFGTWQDLDTKRNSAGGYEYDSAGMLTGYSHRFGDLTIGAVFAYNSGDYKDKLALANDSDIKNYTALLNLNYRHRSGFFANLMGGYAYSDYNLKGMNTKVVDMQNNISATGWTKSDYNADTWMIDFALGYEWKATSCFTIIPSVGISYVDVDAGNTNARWKSLDGQYLLTDRISGLGGSSLQLPVNLALAYDIPFDGDSRFRVSVNGGWAYEFDDDGIDGRITWGGTSGIPGSLAIKERAMGRNTWNVGAGLQYSHGRFDFAAKYDYYSRSKFDAHRVVGSIGIKF